MRSEGWKKEERERVLSGQATAASQYPSSEAEHHAEPDDDGNVPPPYEEPK